jgi:hypothetical protein
LHGLLGHAMRNILAALFTSLGLPLFSGLLELF